MRLLPAVAIAAVLAGCGEDRRGSGTVTTPDPPLPKATTGPAPAVCDEVPVPGHEGRDIEVSGGASCEQAAAIVAAAVGKGRAAYEALGFACEPSDAPAGDTDYACTDGDLRVTFRYGAA